MLRTHAKAGFESVAAYTVRNMDLCFKAFTSFVRKAQLLHAIDNLIVCLADLASRDYLLQIACVACSVGRDPVDCAGVRSLAHIAARVLYSRSSCKYEGQRAFA